MVVLWFSYGCPMVVLWLSYGFPMVFLWFLVPNAHEDTVQVLTFWGEDVLQRPRWTWALDPGLLVEVMALTKKE